jgi:vacuolar iron transporter family protein
MSRSAADTEKADITREAAEIAADPEEERRALADIYERRGLTPKLAAEVAAALHAKDALGAHVREELGISEHTEAKPLAAAGASSLTFAVGAALPLVTAALAPEATITLWVTVLSLIFLALLGAMAVTALVGKLFGAVV